MVGLADQAGLHLGRAASPYLDHPLAGRKDGRGDRHERRRGFLSEGAGDRDPAWRRYRALSPAEESRCRIRHQRAARHNTRSAVSDACAIRRAPTSSSRRCARLLPRYPAFSAVIIGAVDDASFETGHEGQGRGRRSRRSRAFPGRIADRRRAALVSPHPDLRLHLAQRRLRADAARSDGVRQCAGRSARRRGRGGGDRRQDRAAGGAGRPRRAGGGARTPDARSATRRRHGRARARLCGDAFQHRVGGREISSRSIDRFWVRPAPDR